MEKGIEVYKAICSVQGELAKIGISKNHTNSQGSGYKFRGIDDIYNALAPLLAKYELCIIPRVTNRAVVERLAKSGNPLFYVNIDSEFDFISGKDGSVHTARMSGEAMDSGDKGTNKAVSAAYKYVCFQTFCIPTEGDNDADASTYEVMPSKQDPKHTETQHTDTSTMAPKSDMPKVSAGIIIDQKAPNAGGYVSFRLDDGKSYSTKDSIIIETLEQRKAEKEKVCIEYTEPANPKFARSIVGLISMSDVVPF